MPQKGKMQRFYLLDSFLVKNQVQVKHAIFTTDSWVVFNQKDTLVAWWRLQDFLFQPFFVN